MSGRKAALFRLKPTLFISDLHLCAADPATASAFADFLAGPARQARALYILGDLFEFWVGDDQLADPFYAAHCRNIAALAARGVAVFFMAGNRDFLCGQRFASTCSLTLLDDPLTVRLGDDTVLLSHGDIFCTHDIAYQRYRRIVRSPAVQWLWYHLPRFVRQWQARRLRERSQKQTRRKPQDWIDVSPQAIEQAMQQSGSVRLIHGHTHRPAQHQHANGIRHVLPDWHNGHGGYLRFDAHGWRLCALDGSDYTPVN